MREPPEDSVEEVPAIRIAVAGSEPGLLQKRWRNQDMRVYGLTSAVLGPVVVVHAGEARLIVSRRVEVDLIRRYAAGKGAASDRSPLVEGGNSMRVHGLDRDATAAPSVLT